MTHYIHYMARRPGGPFKTDRIALSDGDDEAVVCAGGEYRVACQPKRRHLSRAYISDKVAKIKELFLATGEHGRVTCPDCLKTRDYLEDTPRVA